MQWTLLVEGARPGWQNMAIDCALLDSATEEGAAYLRLYRWEPSCLSFGRNEPACHRYDRQRIATLGLDCVRRPTGGRAVWHAGELTYSVAAPLARFGGLRLAYHRIHEMLAAALRRLGATPALATAPSGSSPLPSAGPCFNAPVGGEVMVADHKVVGSAQLRQGDSLLQHGSLLLSNDQSMARALAGLSDPGAETSLAEALNRPVEFEEAARAVTEVAEQFLGPLEPAPALPARLAAAVERHGELFRDPAWTWRR